MDSIAGTSYPSYSHEQKEMLKIILNLEISNFCYCYTIGYYIQYNFPYLKDTEMDEKIKILICIDECSDYEIFWSNVNNKIIYEKYDLSEEDILDLLINYKINKLFVGT